MHIYKYCLIALMSEPQKCIAVFADQIRVEYAFHAAAYAVCKTADVKPFYNPCRLNYKRYDDIINYKRRHRRGGLVAV